MPFWKKANNIVVSSPKYIKQSISKKIPLVVVDLRSKKQAQKAHIAGAVSIPANQLAAARVKFPAVKKAPIILYTDDQKAAVDAFKTVRSWGYKNTSVLAGGFNGWMQAKGPVQSGQTATEIVYIPKPAPGEISVEKFKAYASKLPSNVFILDARDSDEAAKGMLKGATNIPTQDVVNRMKDIPKNKVIVIHCKTGTRAEMAYQTLKENGYNVKFLKAKMKIKSDGSYRLTKS